MEETIQEQPTIDVPENFRSTISDFAKDLTTTFPENRAKWEKWTLDSTSPDEYKELFAYCLGVYPPRFFEILNQNDDIFKLDGDINTHFLPNVDFKELYHCAGVSAKTRETLWKYLQLILFVLVGTMKDKMDFGDAMNMFDNMGETNLESKLQDAMTDIHSFFSNIEKEKGNEGQESQESQERPSVPNMPQPEAIHDHLMGLFDGKIGKLAKDLAADLTGDLKESLGIDVENVTSSQDVLKQLMQNPGKISGLVKTVGEKLNERMSSGEISQQDLLSEAGSMMRKMKDLGGGDMGAMFKNMAQTMGMNMPNGFNPAANSQREMQIQPYKQLAAKQKADAEEEKARQLKQREEEHAKFMAANPNIFNTDDPNSLVYRVEGETQSKSGLHPSPSNKKKNKKKKK
jgi:hypothetical protein